MIRSGILSSFDQSYFADSFPVTELMRKSNTNVFGNFKLIIVVNDSTNFIDKILYKI